jgi:hypothetical protein
MQFFLLGQENELQNDTFKKLLCEVPFPLEQVSPSIACPLQLKQIPLLLGTYNHFVWVRPLEISLKSVKDLNP